MNPQTREMVRKMHSAWIWFPPHRYTCDLCGRQFFEVFTLIVHLDRHPRS